MSDNPAPVPYMPSRMEWERTSRILENIEKILSGAGFPQRTSALDLDDRVSQLADQYLIGLSRIAGHITPQRIVYSHVTQRGYAAGWTPAQFASRQLVKLVEEVAELAAYINLPTNTDTGMSMYSSLQAAGDKARSLFDEPGQEQWAGAFVFHQAASEAVDVQVALFCLAEAIGLSIEESAITKAASDITRGKRA